MIAIYDIDSTLRGYIQRRISNSETFYIQSQDELVQIISKGLNEYLKLFINTNNIDRGFLVNNIIPLLNTTQDQVKTTFYKIENNTCIIINSSLFDSKEHTEHPLKTEIPLIKTIPHKSTSNYEHVLIGVSTGGPSTLELILPQFSEDITFSIVVVQHMLKGNYIYKLCSRLNMISKITVKVAENNEILKNGTAYFPPPGYHLSYKKECDGRVKLILSPEYLKRSSSNIFNQNSKFVHIPSVDIALESASDTFSDHLIAVILTGMGSDGALSLKYARENGAYTISESQETCIVYGMPKAAVKNDSSMEVLKHYKIPTRISELLNKQKR